MTSQYTIFVLFVGELLETGKVQNAHILSDNEALVLQADEAFVDVTDKGLLQIYFLRHWLSNRATILRTRGHGFETDLVIHKIFSSPESKAQLSYRDYALSVLHCPPYRNLTF